MMPNPTGTGLVNDETQRQYHLSSNAKLNDSSSTETKNDLGEHSNDFDEKYVFHL